MEKIEVPPVQEEEKLNEKKAERRGAGISKILQQAIMLLALVCICFVCYTEINSWPSSGEVAETEFTEDVREPEVIIYLFQQDAASARKAQNDSDFFNLTFIDDIISGKVQVMTLDANMPENAEIMTKFNAGIDSVVVATNQFFFSFKRAGRSRYMYAVCNKVKEFIKMEE